MPSLEEKKKSRMMKSTDAEELYERVHKVLYGLGYDKCLGLRFKDQYDFLRTVFIPEDNDDFYSNQSFFDFEYKSYSPEPIAVINKFVAYWMSYLLSPSETFFKMEQNKIFTQLIKSEENPRDVIDRQFLENLTKDNHSIYQNSNNFLQEGMSFRDRAVFGHSMKVVEPDKLIGSNYLQIRPEDIFVYSSNGNYYDIFGYRSYKNRFQASNTLGDYLWTSQESQEKIIDDSYDAYDDFMVEDNRNNQSRDTISNVYYRINIAFMVLEKFVLTKPDWNPEKRSKMKKIFKEIFYNPDKRKKSILSPENAILDLWISDHGIFNPHIRRSENLIFSRFKMGSSNLSRSAGLGRETKGMMISFADLFLMNLTAFERKNLPPYVLTSETDQFDIDLNKNGVVHRAKGDEEPGILNSQADIPGMVAFWQDMIRQVRVAWHIDDFELIRQTHMTTGEVSHRTSEGFRSVTMLAVQDESQSLSKTVSANTENIYNESFDANVFSNMYLKIKYISALALSQKNSTVEKIQLLFSIFKELGQIRKVSPNTLNSIHPRRIEKLATEALGLIETLKTDEEMEVEDKLEVERSGIMDAKNIEEIRNLRNQANAAAAQTPGENVNAETATV